MSWMAERAAFAACVLALYELNCLLADRVGHPPQVDWLLYGCFALCDVVATSLGLVAAFEVSGWVGGWARNRWPTVD